MDPINPIAGNPEALSPTPAFSGEARSSSAGQSPPSGPQPVKNNHLTVISMAIFVLLSLGAVAFLYYQNQQLKNMLASYQPSPSPLVSPKPVAETEDPTANWKTYTDPNERFSFKYPDYYTSSISMINGQKDPSRTDFSTDTASFLSLITKNLVPYDEKNLCNDQTKVYPCIMTSGWNQKTPVNSFLLDKKHAKNFYISIANGADSHYRIVLTNEEPFIELRMYVSGGGLDRTFDQILSTFKFLGARPPSSPSASPSRF